MRERSSKREEEIQEDSKLPAIPSKRFRLMNLIFFHAFALTLTDNATSTTRATPRRRFVSNYAPRMWNEWSNPLLGTNGKSRFGTREIFDSGRKMYENITNQNFQAAPFEMLAFLTLRWEIRVSL